MKRLSALLLLLIGLASSSPAQVTTITTSIEDEAPLQVVRFSWAKIRPSRLSLETGMPGAEAGPSERLEDLRLQRQVALERRRPQQTRGFPMESLEERQSRRQRRLPDPASVANTTSSRAPLPPRGGGYRYSVELQSAAQLKKVRVVEWDYVFVEPGTNKELLRHSFTSKVEIDAGKRKKVTVESAAAPYGVVDAKGAGDQGGEKIEIKRVVYADGTAWEQLAPPLAEPRSTNR
ncbi:MAG: hypothetical protein WKF30_05985 [Pyrinomonadaceae bacterium]